MNTAYVLDVVRTPRGRGKAGVGALSEIHPQELLAQVLSHLQARNGFPPAEVDDVVVGVVSQIKEQGANLARNTVLAANWPETVTGVTLNRFCGSGLQAVNFAAMGVLSGQQQLVVGGGVESMSRVPIMSDGGGIDGNNFILRNKLHLVPQGISADLIATREDIGRDQLDAFALQSQQRAHQALQENRFEKSIIPVRNATGEVVLQSDENPRPQTTSEALASLDPAFSKLGSQQVGPKGETWDELALQRYPQYARVEHRHTAGNSSGIVDGAAAVLLASETYVRNHNVKPRARIRAMATAGAEPVIMLTAPAPASEKALHQAGMAVSDIDLWEINEAFAVVPLQTIRALQLDPERVNVNGGAIALGHPLGATGAALLGTALDELERRDLQTALVTLCIGGGMGIATVLERI